MDKITGALTLLGIIVVLILGVRGYRTLGNPDTNAAADKASTSALREVATTLPVVILATACIFAVVIGALAVVAVQPISDKESIAAFIAVAALIAMAGYLGRWIWRDRRCRVVSHGNILQ